MTISKNLVELAENSWTGTRNTWQALGDILDIAFETRDHACNVMDDKHDTQMADLAARIKELEDQTKKGNAQPLPTGLSVMFERVYKMISDQEERMRSELNERLEALEMHSDTLSDLDSRVDDVEQECTNRNDDIEMRVDELEVTNRSDDLEQRIDNMKEEILSLQKGGKSLEVNKVHKLIKEIVRVAKDFDKTS